MTLSLRSLTVSEEERRLVTAYGTPATVVIGKGVFEFPIHRMDWHTNLKNHDLVRCRMSGTRLMA
jgi:hypothetical protein